MIKNIIFDVDDVLVDFNMSKYNFLKDTRPEYSDLKYDDLANIFPCSPEIGGVSILSEYGIDGYGASRQCWERPIFPGVIDTLKSLRTKGINLFTLSSAVQPEAKQKWLTELFGDYMHIWVAMYGKSKEQYLRNMLQENNWNAQETLFIDDMFHNVRAGIAVGLNMVRMQPYHYLPLPPDLAHIPVVHNLPELEKYIENINNQ
jgi:FMN phosphatase YigB (HAD superfamily)